MTYTPITAGTLDWDVPLNAALSSQDTRITTNTNNIAVNTADIATHTAQIATKVSKSGDTMTGTLTGSNSTQAFVTNSTVNSAFLKTTSTTEHALTVYQAGLSGTNAVALNVINDNPASSTQYLTGHESARGTLKIAHLNPGPGVADDANAAAISIDLQRNGIGGTASQGIFLTATEGPTTGSLISLRNNSTPVIEELAIRADGKTGVRLPVGNTPQGSLEVRQFATGDIGLVVQGVASATVPIAQVKNSGGTATFEVGSSGAIVTRATTFFTGNLQLGSTSPDFGGAGTAIISMKDATTAPTTNPTAGVIIYSQGGFLKSRDASGNVINLTKQTVTGSRGGNAALASLLTGLATMGLITDSTTA